MRPSLLIVLISFFSLNPYQGAIIESSSSKPEERELLLFQVGMFVGGSIGSWLFGRYLMKEHQMCWANDKNWENRFLDTGKSNEVSLHFIKMMIDSYALELSNICVAHYKRRFEKEIEEIQKEQIPNEAKQREIYDSTYKKIFLCHNWYGFILNHAPMSKYMLSAKHTLLYYKLSFLDSAEGDELVFQEFYREMFEIIGEKKSQSYLQIESLDESNKKMMYTILNYFFESHSILYSKQ